MAAAACGLLLARSSSYEPELLDRHRNAGLAVAVLTLAAAWLRSRALTASVWAAWLRYRLVLAACVAMIAVAGFHGGTLAHGTPRSLLGAL